MWQLLTTLGNFIFPPSPTEELLQSATKQAKVALYQPGSYQGIVYLSRYTEPLVRAAVMENKFQHHRPAARLLAELLSRWAATRTSAPLFVPIPLGKKRQRERGYNQVETIITAATPALPAAPKLLTRTVETEPQTNLNRTARLSNMHDTFAYTGNSVAWEQYREIVLVDDVTTTGATLVAARAALAPHLPPHITLTCLAIAH